MSVARSPWLVSVALGVLCSAAGCTDTAVVGVNLERADASTKPAHDHCEPACRGDLQCHPDLHICVRCTGDDDCRRDDDEPFCDAIRFTCVHCRSSTDCSFPTPRCDDGTCRTCEESPNCSGEHCAHTDEVCRFDNRGPGGGTGGSWPH